LLLVRHLSSTTGWGGHGSEVEIEKVMAALDTELGKHGHDEDYHWLFKQKSKSDHNKRSKKHQDSQIWAVRGNLRLGHLCICILQLTRWVGFLSLPPSRKERG
jgi:hypothetical protein